MRLEMNDMMIDRGRSSVQVNKVPNVDGVDDAENHDGGRPGRESDANISSHDQVKAPPHLFAGWGCVATQAVTEISFGPSIPLL